MGRKVTRREFLKLGALSTAGAVLAGCQRPRRWVNLEPFVRSPEEQLAGQATWYASTCRQCPAGCGIVVRVMNGRALKIEGNPEHPLNGGKVCPLGQAGLQLLYNPDRLPGPVLQTKRGERQYERLDWNAALNRLFEGLGGAGGNHVVWGAPTMSGHVYDILTRLTAALAAPKPVIFDLLSAVNGLQAQADASQGLWGKPSLPTYDLAHADVVFSFGADFLATWTSPVAYGIGFGAFRDQPLGKRGYLVQFEPRLSLTGAKADRWVPVPPGQEALVAQALARLIAEMPDVSKQRAARAAALVPRPVDMAEASKDIGLQTLADLAGQFARADRPLAIPGSTLAGRLDAAEAIAAVQALNLLAGVAGGGGGVGLTPAAPAPGLMKPPASSFAEVAATIEAMRAGQVKALLVLGANPAYDLPAEAGFVEALQHVPLVVSFAPIIDETAAWADLVLPDRTYLESWGYEAVAPAFGDPIVGSQQPVVTPVFDARSAADVLLTVARGLPAAAASLPWGDEVAMLKETITALPPGQDGGSGPDVLWARFLQRGLWAPAQPSAPVALRTAGAPAPATAARPDGAPSDYPFRLHLYLSPMLWDGRGACSPWLQGSPDTMTSVCWQTWVEIHPEAAGKLGIRDGDILEVTSPHGSLEAPAYLYRGIRPDTVAIPFGQGHTDLGRYARGRGANPIHLVGGKGQALAWAVVGVRLRRTGRRAALARMEDAVGVSEGFINQPFPGE